MSSKKIALIVASKHKNYHETAIAASLKGIIPDDSILMFCGENTSSLPVIYNKAMQSCMAMNIDIAIFIHDDVVINCSDFVSRIIRASEMFDVFGLAGANKVVVTYPYWWNRMSSREDYRGCVGQGTPDKYIYYSFGWLPDRAVAIDGVLIGVNIKAIPDTIQWDENIPCKFHFYDLCFSLDCTLAKLKVGVVDIPIVHASIGSHDLDAEKIAGHNYIAKKYAQYKNKTISA